MTLPSHPRKRSPLRPFTHVYPTIMPLHRKAEATMIKNSKIALVRGVLVLMIVAASALWIGKAMADHERHNPATPETTALTLAQYLAHEGNDVPDCNSEDDSSHDLCIWDDGTGDRIVNFNWGTFSYNMDTGQMIDYRSGTGEVVEYKE